jgi:FAD/FMN-containing dehydrogenase
MNELMTWRHTLDGGLALVVDGHVDPIPGPVAECLQNEMVLSPDPGTDVIDLERRLRGIAAEVADEIERSECRLALSRTATLTSPTPWWSWAAWRQWRSAHHERTAAILAHTTLIETYEQTRGLQQQLRQYVMSLEGTTGILAEAARGWRRSPEVPGSVVAVFDSEDAFTTDTRRANEYTWAYPAIGGDILGRGWRRDGDDDAPDCLALDRVGPWAIGYVPRTEEIYATRRSTHRPGLVWLLGTDLSPDRAYGLVDSLTRIKREPNSLIAAAELVADASCAAKRDQAAESDRTEPNPA